LLVSKTPFRVSLFGGGSDYYQHFTDNGGAVLAGAINKYCYITYRSLVQDFGAKYRIRYTFSEAATSIDGIEHPAVKALLKYYSVLTPTEINHSADLPARSGVGSSSSFVVGLNSILASADGQISSPLDSAIQAIHLEQDVIKENVGYQDAITPAFGGLNLIEFHKNSRNFTVVPVTTDSEYLDSIAKCFLLVKVGESRLASDIAAVQVRSIKQHSADLNELAEIARAFYRKLCDTSLTISELGATLHHAWEIKKMQSPLITNSTIDAFYERALNLGAYGGKLCGAGSAGFFLLVADEVGIRKLSEEFNRLGVVNFTWDFLGNQVEEVF
jgi:D-glycero-alpha-D-manno-heptose-7-phosphate kinase